MPATLKPSSASVSPQGTPLPSVLIQLVFMVACGQLAQTIFVPALPMIGQALHADAGELQAIMAAYLLAYGLLQFVYGPVSDRIGRRIPLLCGIALSIVGALLAAHVSSVDALIAASALQGAGTAAAGALSRSIPRDHFTGSRLMQFNSYVSMAVVFLPLVAPFIGSLTAETFGWRAVYYTQAGFSLGVLLMLTLTLKESLPAGRREKRSVFQAYALVLSHRAFRGYTLGLIATFAGIAAFEAIAGVLYGQYLQLSPFWVSIWFVAPIPGYLAGAWIAGKSSRIKSLLNRGIALLGAGATIMLIPGLFGEVVGWTLLLGSVLFFCGAGMMFPTLTSAALEPFPAQAGIAGALLGGLQNFGAGIAALMMAMLPIYGQLSIGLLCMIMVLLVVLALNYARMSEGHTGHDMTAQV
ncbi:MAG: multidrug efflux MFS transporter EmrD [Shewanella sp.]|nr:multidrug efflux MFS transporter EmrD [Shewanella sp.]MCF1431690.1 multidrug efflux MFS transporter EmrD [Shewanella sp.]MCF1459232.1 multidrug efflux MFS transporter EmrD [Shewanella sp.]